MGGQEGEEKRVVALIEIDGYNVMNSLMSTTDECGQT